MEISVIVPTYNRASLLRQTLDSLLNQSHKPAEIIVVDDGSTDDTTAVARSYAGRIKYLQVENGGQGRARNLGAAAATTPWLAFCDSDDLWRPDKLALQVRLFEAAPEVQYAFTNFKTVIDGRWSAETKFDSSPGGYWDLPRRTLDRDTFIIDGPIFEHLLRHQPIFPSTVMMTRSFFDGVGGWGEATGRMLGEDLEFTLRCVAQPPIGVVAAPVVGIRKHAGNFSGDALRTTLGEIAILRYVLEHNPAARLYAEAIRREIAARSASAAEGAFTQQDFAGMERLLEDVPIDSRSWKLRLKTWIARAPQPAAHLLWRLSRFNKPAGLEHSQR